MRHIAIFSVLLAILLPVGLTAQYSRRRPSTATAASGPYTGPAVTFNGTVKAVTKKELVVDLDLADPGADQQTLTFRLSTKTKYTKDGQPVKPTAIEAGMHISLDATRDGDQKLSALNVIVAPPAKPGDKPAEK
jgi:multidrug efflux pump subunit AcrA (membrane-fusion protein)